MIGFIYKWENLINGKVYIGKTINVRTRKNRHLKYVRDGNGYSIHKAISKYGLDNFVFEVIFCTTKLDMLSDIEIEFISEYDSFNTGYNMNPGGFGMKGYCHTQGAIDKMSNAKLGKRLSEDHKLKIGISGLGKKLSEETKYKMSASSVGKPKSESHKINMSLCRQGRGPSEEIRLKGASASKTPEAILKWKETRRLNKLKQL